VTARAQPCPEVRSLGRLPRDLRRTLIAIPAAAEGTGRRGAGE
jgi:hypothetical protein